jgi:hypothetical protein
MLTNVPIILDILSRMDCCKEMGGSGHDIFQGTPVIGAGNKNVGCFKKSFTTLKVYMNLSQDIYSVSNCHNVAKHTEFYLGCCGSANFHW